MNGVTTLKLKEEWFVLKSSDRHQWPSSDEISVMEMEQRSNVIYAKHAIIILQCKNVDVL